MSQFLVAALYRFVQLADYRALRDPLFDYCRAHDVCGTLLLAEEGINGTIAGPEAGVRAVLQYLRDDPRLALLEHKESWADSQPFYRLKVKLKREIVTMGVPNVHAQTMAGAYVRPEQWNDLVADPDVVVIDVRNDYEVAIGSFEGAVNPQTRSFTEFPEWVEQQSSEGGLLDPKKKPRVAMFCTGGIRCEKSTAYLRSRGYDEVYHLEGGILKYLETVPQDESRWDGECFVFDERVSVDHGLAPGQYELCRACRLPLSEQDKAAPQYVEGISCPHCHGTHTPEQMRRFRERQKQVELARKRKTRHIGAAMPAKPILERETDD
ncbi:rhodanese-related sulfurtransferase [Pusillimonas sp.]|uniref:oxygen-dependent tRNA uridine(34) hydroxylase TrhO n=1 Tax=Pusillimonas sp. TaxID=3040095 RepID=UPI0037CB2DF8